MGWNIFDVNRTAGGLFGYDSVNSKYEQKQYSKRFDFKNLPNSNLKVPSSNGVSLGLI